VLKLLADENLDNDILRGLEMKNPAVDIVRVQDVGLQEADDPGILEWAAQNGRIVVSQDRKTMPRFAYERVEQAVFRS
jgi:predicted nuclease of predicted toxin-antitoxin system